MSRVFEAEIDRIALESGCDWDFVVDLYNQIQDRYGKVDFDRLTKGLCKRNWPGIDEHTSVTKAVEELSNKSGYDYEDLLYYLAGMVYDPDDDADWDYFVGVTMERDW